MEFNCYHLQERKKYRTWSIPYISWDFFAPKLSMSLTAQEDTAPESRGQRSYKAAPVIAK